MNVGKHEDLNQLGRELADSGRSLWRAGIGVARRVEEEGRGVFDSLVERGRQVERRQFKALDRTLAATTRQVRDLSDRVQTRMEGGLQETLHRLGLATRDDLQALAGRLEALDRRLDRVAAARREPGA